MNRLALFIAAAMLTAGSAQAQRVEIDPARVTSFFNPILTRPGELIASEISGTDFRMAGGRRTEQFAFSGRAGEVVTAQVRSDIPDLEVVIMDSSFSKVLARGSAKDTPLRVTLPKDATYYISVASKDHVGRYLLSIGSGDTAPPFDPPKPAPAPVQLADAPKAAPASPPAARPAPVAKPAASVAAPKLTPPPGVMAAEIGKPIARPAGKPGMKVDIYAFLGEAGAVVEASAVGAGGYGLALYTPEGAEMLTQTGLGATKLTAVLPQDAVYILAVARQDAAKPYKLSLAAQAPDIFQWAFREGAGYEITDDTGKLLRRSCWLAPGQTLRLTYANGSTSDVTLQAGGAGRVETRGGSVTFTTRFEGGRFTRTFAQGNPATWSIDRPPPRLGAFRGYLCP